MTDAITRVFEKFDELGTARQVFVWWQEQGLPFPARQTESGDRGVAWVSVSYRGILQVLHHPFYAGAYVFGRTETRRELDPENVHRTVVRRGKRSREVYRSFVGGARRGGPLLSRDRGAVAGPSVDPLIL